MQLLYINMVEQFDEKKVTVKNMFVFNYCWAI